MRSSNPSIERTGERRLWGDEPKVAYVADGSIPAIHISAIDNSRPRGHVNVPEMVFIKLFTPPTRGYVPDPGLCTVNGVTLCALFGAAADRRYHASEFQAIYKAPQPNKADGEKSSSTNRQARLPRKALKRREDRPNQAGKGETRSVLLTH